MHIEKRLLLDVIFPFTLYLGTLQVLYGQQTSVSQRIKENFDQGWQFHKGDIAMKPAVKAGGQGGISDVNVETIDNDTVIDYSNPDSYKIFCPDDWKEVNLPHDWVVEGTFVHDDNLGSQPASSGYLPTGTGFYRKEFSIPETDINKKITIEFDGIFRNSTVWANGHLLGGHKSGYTPSNYDLTDVLRYGDEGKNTILVKVDASENEGWWYEGGGIYRHVWLVKTNRLHVARFGTYITTPDICDTEAAVIIRTTLKNEYKVAMEITLASKIVDNSGIVLDTKITSLTIKPFDEVEIIQSGKIKMPLLWSPESPVLYKVHTEVSEKNIILDSYETNFGVRKVEVNEKGVFLNGKLYPVKGTCNHQDFAGIGVALPDKINWYKLKLLKEMGSNAYRCSHHPPTPELLDMCDTMGFLVVDENRHLSSSKDGLEDLTTMLYRDRNHPSIFMWSMENEESIQGTVMGTRILETLVQTTHLIDPTRPVTAAMNHARNDGGYADVLDVVGYNYGDKQMAYVYDKLNHPDRIMFCTEGTSFVSTRGEYEINWDKGYTSNSILVKPDWGPYPGEDWADIVKYPYLGGLFVWTGFDYRGEPTPFRWPCVLSHFGIMDICGFPKDGYYAYKAAWTNEPIVHIFPHWNPSTDGTSWIVKEGDSISVHCYTNCEEVELFLNGMSQGRQHAEPFKKLIWPVIYKPGKLEAKGYKAGKPVTRDIVETTTAPARVHMISDANTLKADGCDVAVIQVAIKDQQGRTVPTANNLVKFEIEGPGKIIGTGNGNPTSHEPDKANHRKAFNGYCMVLVQSELYAGVIRLKAFSETLKESEIIIEVE
jgi:beta-galactosidase